MNDASTFEIRLRGHGDNLALTEGFAAFDNFAAVPEPSTLAATASWISIFAVVMLARRFRSSGKAVQWQDANSDRC
jgi:hypothetical protein